MRIYLIIAVLLLAGSAQAATKTVCPAGCDYTDPQSAVNAANPSDTIEIYSGNYDKMIMTKSLTIRGGHMEPGGLLRKQVWSRLLLVSYIFVGIRLHWTLDG